MRRGGEGEVVRRGSGVQGGWDEGQKLRVGRLRWVRSRIGECSGVWAGWSLRMEGWIEIEEPGWGRSTPSYETSRWIEQCTPARLVGGCSWQDPEWIDSWALSPFKSGPRPFDNHPAIWWPGLGSSQSIPLDRNAIARHYPRSSLTKERLLCQPWDQHNKITEYMPQTVQPLLGALSICAFK